MKLWTITLLVLTIIPLAAFAPTASAGPNTFPVCLMKEAGPDGGAAHAEVWITCGPHVLVSTCPKDGFCRTWDSRDML